MQVGFYKPSYKTEVLTLPMSPVSLKVLFMVRILHDLIQNLLPELGSARRGNVLRAGAVARHTQPHAPCDYKPSFV